eukprot:Em0020g1042a
MGSINWHDPFKAPAPGAGRAITASLHKAKVDLARIQLVSENRIGIALQAVHPDYHRIRLNGASRILNPQPYRAAYFGEKLHNEKLVMFGVTHICAIDGYSGKIVQFVSMPVKNPVQIYQHLFRPILVNYGLFDQIRVDHSKEWTLSLFVQESLAHLRHSVQKPPHRQTSSTLNHTVERCWPEVNNRVNYPIKSCLNQMQDRGDFDLDSMTHKYCVSWVTLHVSTVGVRLFTGVWKCHNIPGKGIPNERMANARTRRLPSEIIPDAHFATSQFVDMGGHLTLESHFGNDPLAGRNCLIAERNRQFHQQYPDLSMVFHAISNNNCNPFIESVKLYIHLTEALAI